MAKKYETKNLNLDDISIENIIQLDDADIYRHAEFFGATPWLLDNKAIRRFYWDINMKCMPIKYRKIK